MLLPHRSGRLQPRSRSFAGIAAALILCAACTATIDSRSGAGGMRKLDQAARGGRAARPWLDARLPIERRVALLLSALTLDEKARLMYGMKPPSTSPAAGYIPGIARLGIPPQIFADGPVGLRDSASNARPATALPATVSLAASFNPGLASAIRQSCWATKRGPKVSMCSTARR